ncbi:methyltransferase type 11 [Ochrobactrum teleogrylli]|uniref:glycosyltransferase family protein n=1 Tax=Ochrobactrum teleogrylli TaxID=2479765 RepID=UPI00384E8A4F
MSGLSRRLTWYNRERANVKVRRSLAKGNGAVWAILCTPHTQFIARAISIRLFENGISSEIIIGELSQFDHDFYVVLCPQMFKRLPPAKRRAVFQLEQSVSSRWFTEKYIRILKDSFAVLEYSLQNISFLAGKKVSYPNVHYLPIGSVVDDQLVFVDESKEYDFVFYGDILSSERRRMFLARLQERYNVRICNDLFGEEIYEVIRRAKAVVNIHYYEGALLETPRICECISLGVPVLSEGTIDQYDYPELESAVEFFEEGSADDMMRAAAKLLDNAEVYRASSRDAALTSARRFNFMFDRFLVAIGAVPADAILQSPIYLPSESDFFVLSLPETIERRRAIERTRPDNSVIFDGVRHALGWIGCGSSFNMLARHALGRNQERMLVIEDDVLLPPKFDETVVEILGYLIDRKEPWDIFSGLMADVHPEASVISVDLVNGRKYVTIDKMTSTVFNIYNRSAMKMLSEWNPLDTDSVNNTIDRYIEKKNNLRVVVSLPFIVGHKEDATSTLWGFENATYAPMIVEAQRKIGILADAWCARNPQI